MDGHVAMRGVPMRRLTTCTSFILALAACTASHPTTRPTQPSSKLGSSMPSSASPQSTPSADAPAPIVAAPSMVKTREGLVIPVPKGWFGSNETGSTGGYWNLYDHDPVKSVKNGIGITIRTADQGVKQVGNVPMCPRSIEETRIDYCGFVTFAQHRWRHIIGETDVPFTEYVTISGRFFYR